MSLTKDDLKQIEGIVNRSFSENFSKHFAAEFPKHFEKHFAAEFPKHFEKHFAAEFPKHFKEHFAAEFTKHFSQSFVVAFETYIIPFVEAKIVEFDRKITGRMDRLEDRIDGFEEKVKHLETKLNERFLSLHDKIDENTVLIGYYFQQCASNDQVQNHEKRLKRLEIAA